MFSMRQCMTGSLASLSPPLFRRVPRHFCFKIQSSFSSFGTRVIGLLNASSGVALEVLYCSTVLHSFDITPHFFFLCGHVDRREVLVLCYPRSHQLLHSFSERRQIITAGFTSVTPHGFTEVNPPLRHVAFSQGRPYGEMTTNQQTMPRNFYTSRYDIIFMQ
jgi:hypothetical protein